MIRRGKRAFLLLAAIASVCVLMQAQAPRTIHLRLLDPKTGRPAHTDGVNIRINHETTVHRDWVKVDDEGVTVLTLPAEATEFSIHATYDDAMEFYVNCDEDPRQQTIGQHWYKVSEVLSTGVMAPNSCVKPTLLKKLKVTAAPGEFVLFVRQRRQRDVED